MMHTRILCDGEIRDTVFKLCEVVKWCFIRNRGEQNIGQGPSGAHLVSLWVRTVKSGLKRKMRGITTEVGRQPGPRD